MCFLLVWCASLWMYPSAMPQSVQDSSGNHVFFAPGLVTSCLYCPDSSALRRLSSPAARVHTKNELKGPRGHLVVCRGPVVRTLGIRSRPGLQLYSCNLRPSASLSGLSVAPIGFHSHSSVTWPIDRGDSCNLHSCVGIAGASCSGFGKTQWPWRAVVRAATT